MNKAVFLDRDGVINREKGSYVSNEDEFELLPGVPQALKVWAERGYLLIVITNQGGIAKKLYTLEQLHSIHMKMTGLLALHQVFLTDIFLCPHHPESGRCICRKPDSLMLEKAIAVHNISPFKSYFVGDQERDAMAGEKAGVTVIRVPPNQPLVSIVHLIR
jgi:D-glycero-D-manno-heptose 1,7-bisphosphate phosphatase